MSQLFFLKIFNNKKIEELSELSRNWVAKKDVKPFFKKTCFYWIGPLVEGEVVEVVELAGGEERQVVPGVGYQGVNYQARVPGDLAWGHRLMVGKVATYTNILALRTRYRTKLGWFFWFCPIQRYDTTMGKWQILDLWTRYIATLMVGIGILWCMASLFFRCITSTWFTQTTPFTKLPTKLNPAPWMTMWLLKIIGATATGRMLETTCSTGWA